MDKKELDTFKQSVYNYSQRFKYCFCDTTGESYPKTFARYRYWRLLDDIEFKHNIQIKPNDEKYYAIYEEIMVTEINKFIEEFKQEVSEQAKEDAKNKQVKRKKG